MIATAKDLGTSVAGATLETSTTDLGTEMANMIVAQKAYSMSSKVVQTADQMIQTAMAALSA